MLKLIKKVFAWISTLESPSHKKFAEQYRLVTKT